MKHYTRPEEFCRECGAPEGTSCAHWEWMGKHAREPWKPVRWGLREWARILWDNHIGWRWWWRDTAWDIAQATVAILGGGALIFFGGAHLRVALAAPAGAAAVEPETPTQAYCPSGFLLAGKYRVRAGVIESGDQRGLWVDDNSAIVDAGDGWVAHCVRRQYLPPWCGSGIAILNDTGWECR